MRIKLPLALTLLLLNVGDHAAQVQQPAPKASIEGVVLRAGSMEPLPGARITLIGNSSGPSANTTGAAPTATADSDGRFILKDIASGTYRLGVGREGYVGQEFGQPSPFRNGEAIVLVEGETRKGVVFQLIPTGSVNGHIRDASGRPLEGVHVQALRQGYGADGQRIFQPSRSTTTNDRGEFRLYWIPPGRYTILASLPESGSSTVGLVHVTVAAAFYPGIGEPTGASVLNIRAGDDIIGMDWLLSRQAVRLRGRIVDPATGQAPQSASIAVVQRDLGAARFSGTFRSSSYNSATGTFETPGLNPGTYWVSAVMGSGGSGGFGGANGSIANGATIGDQVMVNATADVDNIVLSPIPSFSVAGRVHVDEPGLVSASDLASIRVSLQGAPAIIRAGQVPVPESDGSFVLASIGPGQYQLRVTRPPDFYIKHAQFGRVDILGQTVTIQRPGTDSLNVGLSPRGGRIDGLIVDDRSQPAAEADVVLVPDRLRDRVDLYQSVRTDLNGRFAIRGISPGDYKLFAWEYVEPYEYFDPELLRQSERQALSVRIVESSRESVNLRMTKR